MADEARPKTLAEALERAAAGWAQLKAAYAGLSEEELTRPGVNGSWSVKDVVAHVAAWHDEAYRAISGALAGGEYPRFDDAAVDAFNARVYEARRDLPLDQVLADAERSHERLVALLRGLPEERYQRDERLQRWIGGNTFGHYEEHLPDLQAWRELVEFL